MSVSYWIASSTSKFSSSMTNMWSYNNGSLEKDAICIYIFSIVNWNPSTTQSRFITIQVLM